MCLHERMLIYAHVRIYELVRAPVENTNAICSSCVKPNFFFLFFFQRNSKKRYRYTQTSTPTLETHSITARSNITLSIILIKKKKRPHFGRFDNSNVDQRAQMRRNKNSSNVKLSCESSCDHVPRRSTICRLISVPAGSQLETKHVKGLSLTFFLYFYEPTDP
ncbi:hypothetical protein PUN28_004844 [Cardiocondyla obscurior]|uniref:Uncharacterized protein n=1 Tax=Cardiocondyla obscurior TaxID=286306 RepID=A0AAW2GFI2_9HYME